MEVLSKLEFNQNNSQKITSTMIVRREKFFQLLTIILWCLAAANILLLIIYSEFSAFDKSKLNYFFWYIWLIFIPLMIIGILSLRQWCRYKITGKTTLLTGLILISIFLVSIWLINYESYDWCVFLKAWCGEYQNMTWGESLRNITTISDYTPFYNYFLIIFSHLFDLQGCLYAIKYLTFLFSIAMAVVMEFIICTIKQSKFSYLHLACFLILPPILLESNVWAQCDTIYTTFALLAFYFALKHRSVLCFISLGLSFAIKLQFLFIVPIIFIMLLIRDKDGHKYLSWKWIWLALCMYAINFLPLFTGANLIDLLKVYFLQIGSQRMLSLNCMNIPFLFENLLQSSYSDQTYLVLVIIFSIIGIAATMALLILVLRAHHRRCLTAVDLVRYALCFAMVMVYFMPKMHDRYFFIAFVLSIIWAIVEPSKLHALISAMVSVSLSFAIYTMTVLLSYTYVTNLIGLILFLKKINIYSMYFGFLLNTIALICLVTPIIRHEIKTHDDLTKNNARDKISHGKNNS
ncbi:MAG: hypothetical protein J5580_01320 [Clostridia bacterium]|nr:hypothetical protein [Clostridia bacterium]